MKTAPSNPYSAEMLRAAQALPDKRLSQLEFRDKSYFVKMAEQHSSLRWRVQKGDPKAAFLRERALLTGFHARGAAVPEIVAQDDHRIILADHGPTVNRLLTGGAEIDTVLQAAGAALAALHAAGLAHGRPSLRDLCWDGHRITFLDLEAGARLQAEPRHQARDLFLLLHSAIIASSGEPQAGDAILRAYRLQGDPDVWNSTYSLVRKLASLDVLASPVIWWHIRRGKRRSEFLAFRKTRELVLAHARAPR